ncbi:DUF6602 domain-containing protein [Pseudarthrobacter oxydans]|uniref:DUF6602 domain-containing protein n=1 Tax=Pseudarthrobacter oxydans TaxID=1671 RepID=UPI00344DA2FC
MVMPFDLGQAFTAKQNHMLTGLGLMPNFTSHPTAKGDATEDRWINMLSEFLPRRYGVGKVFAIDSKGNQSQQIDVAVYDQQYSPLFFEQSGLHFVPVESIYAVFEAKPELDKGYVEYARDKVASVRSLHRTSVGIRHAGGTYAPQDPATKPILGGILATGSAWADIQGEAARTALLQGDERDRLDFAIAVQHGAVERVGDELFYAVPDQQLIWFAMQLFKRLSTLGTVLALDLSSYGRHMEDVPAARLE